MQDDQRGKDAQGRFLPGNKYSPKPIDPDEPREQHPVHLGRDTKGRVLRGARLPNYKTLRSLPPAVLYRELHGRLLDAVDESDIQKVYNSLLALTQQTESKDIQLKSIKLYLDRFFGLPAATFNVSSNSTSTEMKVSIDLTALSDDELNQYLSLQGKVQAQLTHVPNADVIVDVEPVQEAEVIEPVQEARGEV